MKYSSLGIGHEPTPIFRSFVTTDRAPLFFLEQKEQEIMDFSLILADAFSVRRINTLK